LPKVFAATEFSRENFPNREQRVDRLVGALPLMALRKPAGQWIVNRPSAAAIVTAANV
jgi:hypothetical protein